MSRRGFIGTGIGAILASRLVPALAGEGDAKPVAGKHAKNCIVLWMNGGPSHVDTWDVKKTSGFKSIATQTPGLEISENFPLLAAKSKQYSVIRSVTSKEADHGRAIAYMHTGNIPQETVNFPALGAVATKEWEASRELPVYVSVGDVYGDPGFLGLEYAPFVVDLENPTEMLEVSDQRRKRFKQRVALLDSMNTEFARRCESRLIAEDSKVQKRALSMMSAKAVHAFDIKKEADATRAAYGDSEFGRGCLLARRLVENGVRFVEVSLDGWDTHENNDDQVKKLCGTVDPAMSTLLQELTDRRLLDETLVIWMGEFGRTPEMNGDKGRDHHSKAFSIAMAGGGVSGGRVIGKTDESGTEVADRPVTIPDLYTTIFQAFGLDGTKRYETPEGRPVKLVEKGSAVAELF
jgi:hypothetical protein